MDEDKIKEILGELKIYVELGTVAFAGLQAILKFLDKDHDLSQAELQEILIKNRQKIKENEEKIKEILGE